MCVSVFMCVWKILERKVSGTMMDSFSVLNSLLVKLSDLVTPRQGDGSLHGCKHCVFVAGGCPFPFDLFFCFY